jgi:hypothetical protein
MLAWARWRGWTRASEATPLEVARYAASLGEVGTATWAEQVVRAAYGPEPVDDAALAGLRGPSSVDAETSRSV